MMFAAAGWLWLNLQNYTYDVSKYGIPFTYYEHWSAFSDGKGGSQWYFLSLAVDIVFGLGLVFGFGLCVEWLTNRLSRRQKMD